MTNKPMAFVTEELLPGEVTFGLPIRSNRRLAIASWCLAATIAAITLGIGYLLSLYGGEWPYWANALFVVFEISMLAVSVFFAVFGVMLVAGRNAIKLDVTRLYAMEYYTATSTPSIRVYPVDSVDRIEVVRWGSGRPVAGDSDDLSAIRVVFRDGRRARVATAYPARILVPLARELAARCHAVCPENLQAEPTTKDREEPTRLASSPVGPSLIEQPAGSRIQWTRQDDMIIFEQPAAGRRMHGILLVLGLIAVMIAISVPVASFACYAFEKRNSNNLQLAMGLGVFVIWITVVLIRATLTAFRSTRFQVTQDGLAVDTSGLFGKKQAVWTKSDILQVLAYPRKKDSDVQDWALRIVTKGDQNTDLLKSFGMLELHWLAESLRQALELPPPMAGGSLHDEPPCSPSA